MSSTQLPIRPPVLVHHMAAGAHQFPPNSLPAIVACIEGGAACVEVDVTALADRDYLLVHEPTLEVETTGRGPVADHPAEAARRLRIVHRGRPTEEPVPLLSDVIEAFRAHPGPTRLQLDFKNVVPFPTDEPFERLVRIVEPVRERVTVSSAADWQLRRLRRYAPWLDLGLDIHVYLERRPPESGADPRAVPRHLGAYGYRDDHPLAWERRGATARYLEDRVGMLVGLVPGARTFYVEHHFLVQGLDDGFNWAEALHREGIRLDAWTLDVDRPDAVANARRLLAAGADQFTTNTPIELAALLGQEWV